MYRIGPSVGHWKIWLGWSVIVAAGIGAFAVCKLDIDKKRYENMKIRERIRNSNRGDYTQQQTTSENN